MKTVLVFCDDDIGFLDQAEKIVSDYMNGSDTQIVVERYTTAESLITAISEGKRYDGYFLDVQLPGTDGYHLAKTVRGLDAFVPIILISNYDTYLREGYALSLYRYLKKPLSKEDLEPCLIHCLKRAEKKRKQFEVHLIDDGEIVSRWIQITKIRIAYCAGHRVSLVYEDETISFSIHSSFSSFITEELNGLLIQCNQSEAVNPEFVSGFSHQTVFLKDNSSIMIGRRYRSRVEEQLNLYFAGEEQW